MADDNVTDLGNSGGGQGGGVKPASAIMKEIQNNFNKAKADAFKAKAAEKMKEIEKIEASLALAKLELQRMVEEYQASVSS